MRGIARKSAPINVIVHYPKTEQGKRELAERVAGVHADMVNQKIKLSIRSKGGVAGCGYRIRKKGSR